MVEERATVTADEFGVLLNISDSPVFDVSVGTVHFGGLTARTPLMKCRPPGDFVYGRADDYDDHPKNSHWSYAMTKDEFTAPIRPYSLAPGKAAIEDVTFADALNQRWTRASNGALMAILDEEPPRCSDRAIDPANSST
ncbi:hypothetical protein GCM10022256_00630 [Frondihabitans peucedani]|uniref:Uncharacterized protein n=1 Tax=Frondihabitans peucedani TaxID=598626 RepID=A0ABP8DWS7_9MICO